MILSIIVFVVIWYIIAAMSVRYLYILERKDFITTTNDEMPAFVVWTFSPITIPIILTVLILYYSGVFVWLGLKWLNNFLNGK